MTLANGAPVIAKRIFGQRYVYPMDANVRFYDGRRLFGSSKTVRGVACALIVTALAAPLVGLSVQLGLVIAAAAMAGDLLSSFTKRRLGLPASSRAIPIDQVPESLFPLLACYSPLGLSIADVVAGVLIFLIGGILLSRVLFRLRVRDRPY
jgi:CDP-2,3-bis-(O-geranylgeranyl)-sn-glycerol synthase